MTLVTQKLIKFYKQRINDKESPGNFHFIKNTIKIITSKSMGW